jgi:hypothetical protein
VALPYTPDTVAARLYDALEPIQGSDPDTGYHLLIYTSGLALPMEEVSDLAETGPNGEVGWSIIVDINRVPDKALGWLAQFVGVKLNPDLDADDQRDRIRTTDGWNRGTPSAIAGAAAQYLTGPKYVVMRERYNPGVGPDPYHLQIWTVASQTPDPAATLNAIMAQKPAGLILHYSTMAGQDFQKLYTDQAHFQQVYTTYPTMQDVYLDTA